MFEREIFFIFVNSMPNSKINDLELSECLEMQPETNNWVDFSFSSLNSDTSGLVPMHHHRTTAPPHFTQIKNIIKTRILTCMSQRNVLSQVRLIKEKFSTCFTSAHARVYLYQGIAVTRQH